MVEIKNIYSLNLKAIPIKIYKTSFSLSDEFINKLNKKGYCKQTTKQGTKGALVSNNTHVFKDKFLEPVKKFIDKMSDTYAKNALGITNKLIRVNDWISLCTKGRSHHEHRHPNCLFSVVFYARIKSGALTFYVDRSAIEESFYFEYDIKKYNEHNSSQWTIQPQQGDVVIFPGDLRHGTTPNEHDENRIVFGANYFLTGKVGNEPYSTYVIK